MSWCLKFCFIVPKNIATVTSFHASNNIVFSIKSVFGKDYFISCIISFSLSISSSISLIILSPFNIYHPFALSGGRYFRNYVAPFPR